MRFGRISWKALKRKITELIFPSSIYCICCGKYIDESRAYSLCDHCIKRMDFSMKKLPLKQGDSLDSAAAAMGYGLYERQLIFGLKYGGKTYISRHIADILYDCMKKRLYDTGDCPQLMADVIVPVPLHAAKMKQRGFNQADKIALRLGERTGISVCSCALRRERRTSPQRALSAAERRRNVEGAFKADAGRARILKGKRVLLIDDIYTTGATALACAESLKEAGAARVDFIALTAAGGAGRRIAFMDEQGYSARREKPRE